MYFFSYLEPVCCSMSSSKLLLPDLHTGFSRGRPGSLFQRSLSEFSTVYCDPHSQRLWCIYIIDAFELWFVVLEKTVESPLDSNEIKPVNPKGNQPWLFIGRINAEAEPPILWPPNVKSWIIGKDPDAGKDWDQEAKWMTEDEMVGWHHWLNGHEFEQALGDGDGQGGLMCCSPWDQKELDKTYWLNTHTHIYKWYICK